MSKKPATASTTRSTAAATAPSGRRLRTRPVWRWRTFPVFAALCTGMLIAFFVNKGSANPVAAVVMIAALLGVGYSLAHLVVTNIVTVGRTKRSPSGGETEDVIVHPDE